MNPSFVSNNIISGRKVLTTLETELSNCLSFSISVAFITVGGITPLLETLKMLEKKGIQGRILTTDYLMFSDPVALKKLNSLSNIELRMYCCDKVGFHTKGYIFEQSGEYHVLVGSSNLTMNALTVNKEWNTYLSVNPNQTFLQDLSCEFDELWNADQTLAYEDFIDAYSLKYKESKAAKKELRSVQLKKQQMNVLSPNSMQKVLIENFLASLDRGDTRGLLVSATGTGKTYASAFALREIDPKRILFLVHREQIAKQALSSYKHVFGQEHSFGLLSGNSKDFECDYLFSTMQTMAKDDSLSHFDRDDFDVIVIDEVHRAGASSYQKIMNYFRPAYWFGMSASPERSDNFDIYSLFDHNILYEIRLQQALEEDLLCPFHYFGITDLEINGKIFDDETGLKNFSFLVSDSRVDHIIRAAEYYGYSGDRVKGLIFCSTRKEADELSLKFNERGYRTISLSGADGQLVREECIDRLTSDTRKDALDYIFTVDIFNEGVDIPEINQIIMLRPTQSAIIFIQQLGRGLRKQREKEFVVILDFIANYKNNFLIPLALSGDRTYNKDTVRRYVQEGTKAIPGSSTIHFDEISKKRIYESIDAANFNDVRLIKESYQQLKFKLGRVPDLMSFDVYGAIDPLRIFDNKSLGSYHMFLKKYEKKEYHVTFSETQEKFLEFISRKFAAGKRPHELLILDYLLKESHGIFAYLKNELKTYHIDMTEKTRTNLINVLTNEFASGTGKDTYAQCIFIQPEGDDYGISSLFEELLNDDEFRRQVKEIVEFGLYRNRKEYSDRYEDTSFQLYSKYTYEEVCRLLEWRKSEVALNIGGYKYDKETKTYPVFINYDKSDDIADTIKYEDHLKSRDSLIAISKSGRSIQSEDVQAALNSEKLDIEMELFIRKNKDDKISKEFYYMGKIVPTGACKEFMMPNTNKSAVEIEYQLKTAIKDDLFDYITN